MRRFLSILAGLTRFATLAVALMLACLAPQANALLTPSHPGLSAPAPSQAHAPESILIIEETHPIGYADDGECLDLCICVEPETLTRVFYIVKSPTGLFSDDLMMLKMRLCRISAGHQLPGYEMNFRTIIVRPQILDLLDSVTKHDTLINVSNTIKELK